MIAFAGFPASEASAGRFSFPARFASNFATISWSTSAAGSHSSGLSPLYLTCVRARRSRRVTTICAATMPAGGGSGGSGGRRRQRRRQRSHLVHGGALLHLAVHDAADLRHCPSWVWWRRTSQRCAHRATTGPDAKVARDRLTGSTYDVRAGAVISNRLPSRTGALFRRWKSR